METFDVYQGYQSFYTYYDFAAKFKIPPVTSLFCCNFEFFRTFQKNRTKNFRIFFNEIDCQKFSKFLTAQFIEKKIKKVFTVEFIEKTFENCFIAEFIEKYFEKFLGDFFGKFEKMKKKNLLHNFY